MNFALTVAASIAAALTVAEFRAWAPRLPHLLMKAAVRRSPLDLQARLLEEWSAHLDDVPGDLSRIAVAAGFLLASGRLPSSAAQASSPTRKNMARIVIRCLDLNLAFAFLVAVGPLMLLTAIAIKIVDGGPVLLVQERIGRGGRPLRLFKFKTILDEETSRPTRLGLFLKTTSIDELPQMLNVLNGGMSLVGKRPKKISDLGENDQLDPLDYSTSSLPGLTATDMGDGISVKAYVKALVASLHLWTKS